MARVVPWISSMLSRRPIITNTTIFASFYTAAEISQQTFNKYFTPEKPDYDLKATARIVTVGSTLYAPTLYVWYKFLDRKFPGKVTRSVIAKVCADQFLMTPVLLAIFYTTLSVLERKDDIFQELREKYVMTLLANQCFWLPTQIINFAFVAPHLRVIYVATASFIWINVLCFIKRQKTATPNKV